MAYVTVAADHDLGGRSCAGRERVTVPRRSTSISSTNCPSRSSASPTARASRRRRQREIADALADVDGVVEVIGAVDDGADHPDGDRRHRGRRGSRRSSPGTPCGPRCTRRTAGLRSRRREHRPSRARGHLGGRPVVIVEAGPTGVTAALSPGTASRPWCSTDGPTSTRGPRRAPRRRGPRILGRLGVDEEFGDLRPARAQIGRPRPGVLAEFARDDAADVHGYPQANMFDQPALEVSLRLGCIGR